MGFATKVVVDPGIVIFYNKMTLNSQNDIKHFIEELAYWESLRKDEEELAEK